MLRKLRVMLLGVALTLVASVGTSSFTALANAPTANPGCADTTPLKYLSRSGAQTAAVTDPATLSEIGAAKARTFAPLQMTPSDKAAAEAASARKLARTMSGGLKPARNVSVFSSRTEALQACGAVRSNNNLAANIAGKAGALAAGAIAHDTHACAFNSACSGNFAYIQNLNHQDEGDCGLPSFCGNYTWCGPATVSMIAWTEPGPSNVRQPAARDWISNYQRHAVEDGGTDFGAMAPALNNFVSQLNLGYDFYLPISVDWTPTSQQRSDYHWRLWSDIVSSGYAVAGNVIELAGYVHLYGHPRDQNIGHYIEIGGIDGDNSQDYYSDSATALNGNVQGWSGVPAYAWFPEYDMVTLIGGAGYDW